MIFLDKVSELINVNRPTFVDVDFIKELLQLILCDSHPEVVENLTDLHFGKRSRGRVTTNAELPADLIEQIVRVEYLLENIILENF